MEAVPKQRITETLGVTPWSHMIYSNADEFWKNSEGLHHAYTVYRTLAGEHKHLFKPDAVFYVGQSPSAYLKHVHTNLVSEDDVRQWQRFLWNQAVVPMLIIKSRTQIRVYTAFTQPKERHSHERITAILEETADALELDQLWTAIEAETIYEEKPDAFQRKHAVDRFLLDNLNTAAHLMAETQKGGVKKKENLEFVHQFLTRILFACYLIERDMVKGQHFEDKRLKQLQTGTEAKETYLLRHLLLDIRTYAQKRDTLCRLFARIKQRFNGSLFPEGIVHEKDRYNEDFIRILELFLQGHDLPHRQLTLGFWAYDFSVIPIETISGVYESFLGAQGELGEANGRSDSKRSVGAFYTPIHLAELVVDMAIEGIEKPVYELNVLDPACGSGVFLVSLFTRMAESLRRAERVNHRNHCIDWARKLLLRLNQLHGVDINRTACHITCFSLYLALLEQLTPMDVEDLHRYGETLPPLLAEHSSKGNNTIHHGNLFDPDLALEKHAFDIVIGNPPWVSRKNTDRYFLKWLEPNPRILGPEKQIAHGFMWKAPEYLCNSGVACLLLPTAVLLNDHTNQFQEQWFQEIKVERIVNFSDLRFVLFEKAVHPCIAIRFKSMQPHLQDTIQCEAPKVDLCSQLGGPVYIHEEECAHVEINKIVEAASEETTPVLWKSLYWGTWRDRQFLSRLNDYPKLRYITGNTFEKGQRWNKSRGAQIGNRKYHGWWNKNCLFVKNTKNVSLAITSKDCKTVGASSIPLKAERPRRKDVFQGPKVLISDGSRDMNVAFCNFTALFQDSLRTITGPKKDADFLRFLCAVVKSKVAQYFLFHTSANWGTEREKVHFHELLSLPFFLPDDAGDPGKALEIIKQAAGVIKDYERRLEAGEWLDRQAEALRIRREVLEPLVCEYYDIDKYEAMLIEDTLQLAVKSFHPRASTRNIPTLCPVSVSQSQLYAKTLCKMLNHFGRGSSFKVNGEILKGEPYSVIHLNLTDRIRRAMPVITAEEGLIQVFDRIRPLMQEIQGRFVFCQNLKIFDGDDLFVIKPMQTRFWSRTAALNDADEIAGSILSQRESECVSIR